MSQQRLRAALIILGLAVLAYIVLHMAFASAESKADEPCTGFETVGRCADKCPAGYYQQGIDKETGAAVCKEPGKTDPSQTNPMSQNMPDAVTQADIDANIAAENSGAVYNPVDNGDNFTGK